MKTLYLECNMGAAGDMLTAALTELMPDPDAFVQQLNDLQIPQVKIKRTTIAKCGIMGTHMEVTVNGEEEKSVDVPLHMHEHHHEDHDHIHAHHHEGHDHVHEHHHEEHDHVHEHHHEGHDHVHEHTHGHSHHHTSMKDIEHIIGHLNVPEKVKEDAIAVYKLIADAESHAHGCPVEEIHFHEVGAMDAVADIVGVCLAVLLFMLVMVRFTVLMAFFRSRHLQQRIFCREFRFMVEESKENFAHRPEQLF